MSMKLKSYSTEILKTTVQSSTSILDVFNKLKIEDNGGNRETFKRRIQKFDISIKHFTGKSHRLGISSTTKLPFQKVLTKHTKNRREDPFRLRRALIESGRDYVCETCKTEPFWQGQELRLQVDHKNNDFLDNRKENLRFLCPNCHSQTPSYCGSMGLVGILGPKKTENREIAYKFE